MASLFRTEFRPCACSTSTPATQPQAQHSRAFLQTLLHRLTVLTLVLDSINTPVSFTYMAQTRKGTRGRTLVHNHMRIIAADSNAQNNYTTRKETRTLSYSEQQSSGGEALFFCPGLDPMGLCMLSALPRKHIPVPSAVVPQWPCAHAAKARSSAAHTKMFPNTIIRLELARRPGIRSERDWHRTDRRLKAGRWVCHSSFQQLL